VSPRAAAAAEAEPRRHGVLGALAAALPDRGPRRGDDLPELRVVGPAARRRRSWQVGSVAGGLLFLAMFVIVGAQTLIVQQQRHIDDVNSRVTTAENQAEQLKIDLAELQSPERIMHEAKDRLGMVLAPSPVYLQPGADDDARAAEVPAATPPTTAAKPKTTTPTTTAKGTTSSTVRSTTPSTTATGTAR
jgi:cell division protein FtsL